MNKEEFIEIAKQIEIHIHNNKDYKACIGLGYFTERFNEVYEKLAIQNSWLPFKGFAKPSFRSWRYTNCTKTIFGKWRYNGTKYNNEDLFDRYKQEFKVKP